MAKLYFEKMVEEGNCSKIYFTSYLRADFVERSLVVTLNKNHTLRQIYFSSYDHGSAEWFNGDGLAGGRKWENEDQAVSPTYLTRRYTVRMADGPAMEEFTGSKIIPDVLDNMADRNFAGLMTRIVRKKKYSRKVIIDESGFIPRAV